MAWTIDMTGQVSLITGGATGIGAATARSLAKTGSNIAVNYYPSDRDRAAAKELVAELEAMGVRAKGYEADITKEDQVNAMVQAILADFGQIDNLFNNAGIIIKAKMHEMSYSDFRKVVSVALDGAFLVTKAVLPNMLSRKCGDIVFMGSGTVKNGGGDSVAYPAGKGAVEGMVAQMVNEYSADGIRVNFIRPMVIMTPIMRARYTDESYAAYCSHLPMGRGGTPEEVADLVTFLLDRKRSGFLQGVGVDIDGGRIYHVKFR